MKQNQAINSNDTNPFKDADTFIDKELRNEKPLIDFLKVKEPALLYVYMAVEFIFIYLLPAPKTILGIILCVGVLIFQVVCIREYIKIFQELEQGKVQTNFTKYVIFVVEGRVSNIFIPIFALLMFVNRTAYLELIYVLYLIGIFIIHIVTARLFKRTLKFMIKYRISLKALGSLIFVFYVVVTLVRSIIPENTSGNGLSDVGKIIFLLLSLIVSGIFKWIFWMMALGVGQKKVHRYLKLIILFFPEYYHDLESSWNATIQKVE